MYLDQVLNPILAVDLSYSRGGSSRKFTAEDLYKVNEAVFNLPEEDQVDKVLAKKLFDAVQKIVKAYMNNMYDQTDPNFFYDYVALLSTMQNQHFFNEKQNKTVLKWLLEAIGTESQAQKPPKPPKQDKAILKDIANMEDENAKLAAQIAKLKELSSAVVTIQTFKMPKPLVPSEEKVDKESAASKEKEKEKDKAKEKAKVKTKTKSKQSENNPDVKPVLEKMRALGKELKAEGKSEDEIKEQLAPLKEELKAIKVKFKEEKAKEKAAAEAAAPES